MWFRIQVEKQAGIWTSPGIRKSLTTILNHGVEACFHRGIAFFGAWCFMEVPKPWSTPWLMPKQNLGRNGQNPSNITELRKVGYKENQKLGMQTMWAKNWGEKAPLLAFGIFGLNTKESRDFGGAGWHELQDVNERYYTDFTNPAMWMVLRLYSVKHYYSPSRLTLLAYHHFGATPLMLLVQRYLLRWSGPGPKGCAMETSVRHPTVDLRYG